MYERLISIMRGLQRGRVLLVGDFMLDHYVYGDIERISPEAPVMVLNVARRQEQPGGAGSVAADLAALGAEVACLGIVGNDGNGRRLRMMLEETGRIDVTGLLAVGDRPTTWKQRVIGLAQQRHQQQLLRIDEEERVPIAGPTRESLLALYKEKLAWCGGVCLEDYNKGVLEEEFCRELIATAWQAGKPVIVDPAAIRDYRRYAGSWLIKPNRRELGLATGRMIDGEESWQTAARQLAEDCEIEHVVVTLDKQGSYLYSRAEQAGRTIPTRPRSVYDVTGAGDMVLAMLGMLAAGEYEGCERPRVEEMVSLANVAGGLEVERFGCVGISREEILAELTQQRRLKAGKFRTLESLLGELEWHRRQGHTIVFTNGCYDLLHPGHVQLLGFAKEQGDVLIVAINSDRSVRELKGDKRPILQEQDRAAILAALEAVDYVIVFDEPDPGKVIERITPDVLIKGSDWTGNVVGQEWVEAHGGKVVLQPLVKGKSTTGIIEEVLKRYTGERVKEMKGVKADE